MGERALLFNGARRSKSGVLRLWAGGLVECTGCASGNSGNPKTSARRVHGPLRHNCGIEIIDEGPPRRARCNRCGLAFTEADEE